jgi:hypothetical protein
MIITKREGVVRNVAKVGKQVVVLTNESGEMLFYRWEDAQAGLANIEVDMMMEEEDGSVGS